MTDTPKLPPPLPPEDGRPIPEDPREIRLFAKIRNEAGRLPAFLDHYRNLGVGRFLLIDNGSDDGSVDFLRQQPDCHLFVTQQKMSSARAGMDWIEPLLNLHGMGQWCVVVDADELLIYAGCETRPLPDFCARLAAREEEALHAMMLDMYPRGAAIAADYRPGMPFLQACPYFDRSGYRIKMLPDGGRRVIGGPRLRVFYPDMLDWRPPARIARAIRYRLADMPGLRGIPAIQRLRPPYPPLLNKVPLVRWRPGLRYASAGHYLHGARMSAATAALLHFKFLGDFEQRARAELSRGAYENDGADYRRYVEGLQKKGGVDFSSAVSERYESSAQLVRLGLIQPLPAAGDQRAEAQPVLAAG
ncbi:glycosyltransferase family 2 protein [Teichococcus aerofrigidensis]